MDSMHTSLVHIEEREVALQLNTLLHSVDNKFSNRYYSTPLVPRLSDAATLILERNVQNYCSSAKVNSGKGYIPTANNLRSNIPLGPQERGGLQQSIHNAKADLADIDHGISSVQLEIDRLLKELSCQNTLRRSKQAELDSLHALISPVRLLPSKILGKIFLELDFHPSPRFHETSPLLLSHVCSAWRNTALGVPSLWNRLKLDTYSYVTLPGFIPADSEEIVPRTRDPMLLGDLLATWFSRAINTNKLSLSLTTHDDSLQKEAKIHLLEKILEFLPHFSELSLKDRGYIVVSPLLEVPPGRLMMLERLCLDFNRIPDRAKFPASATVFKDAPNLKDVQLQVPSSTLNHNSRFSLPWSQLTRLIIDVEMTLPDFCNVIFQSTAIRTALFTYINLRNDGDLPDGWTPPSPCLTAFPQLTDLVLEFHAWSYIGSSIDYQTIIQNLYLPKIEKLCLAGNIIGLGLSQPPLPRIDPGTLRILSLLEMNVDIATLTELVRVSPLIEELTLCLSRVSAAQLLNALAADDMASRGQTFERLKEFRFAYCPDESHTLEDYTAVGMAFSALVKRWIVDQSALLHAVLVVYEPKARHKMLDIAHGLGEIAREYGRTDFRAEMKVVRDGPNLRRALELYYVLRGPKY